MQELKKILASHAKSDDWDRILEELNVAAGDIVALSDRQDKNYENPTPLGRFRQLITEKQIMEGKISKSTSACCWVDEFPLFEPQRLSDQDGYPTFDRTKLTATHHPFTMVDLRDYESLEKDPLGCRSYHFDLVIDGTEVGGGSTRVHDADLQMYIFEHLLNVHDSKKVFGHLLDALASGCPPHAGLAIGLDRFVAIMLDTESLRDVIAFPKTITGADPLIGSPNTVSPEQLKPYHLKLT